jgi:cell division protein FtsB
MSPQKQRKKLILFLGAIAALGVASALDPSGIRKHLRLQEDVVRMRTENERLASENARLAREVRSLRGDPAAIERAVREELRYVREGEIVIRTEGIAGGTP